ncbi:MAG: formate dehydrogenase subunit gamma [Defluviimonas sp.]|uniref:formate dehydrogenase subunit gamma n=1 Tax=Albidovulum sp. TaxID=1872424 RepID=UPI001D618628|nr:formate dehydrogenase subunit gamma [Paracoccaceae bacterium]MCC0062878.1 formate dehydrogenase subunit gamma [Defluviimonas sp.]
MSGTTGAAASERILATISEHLGLEGPLLPILHAVQAEFGYVPQDAVAPIAKALNITRAEVHGVMSFYHDFRTEPAGAHVVKICRAEACQAAGADAAVAAAEKVFGTALHGTSADGKVTLEPVYCLGLCACGPSAMVDGKVVGHVDEKKLGKIAKEMRA